MKAGFLEHIKIRSEDKWVPIANVDTYTPLQAISVAKFQSTEVYPKKVLHRETLSFLMLYDSPEIKITLPVQNTVLSKISKDARWHLTAVRELLDRPGKILTAQLPELPIGDPVRIDGKSFELKRHTGMLTGILIPGHAILIKDGTTTYWCGAVQNGYDLLRS